MFAARITPILNVSNIEESFEWFEALGWKKGWEWGTPPTFGGVCSGHCEIFLCKNGQGGRDPRPLPAVNALGESDAGIGVWMSVWVEDVDAIHRNCLDKEIEVTMAPTDEPWGVQEMHIRHPDGHTFRISQGLGDSDAE